MTLGARFAHVNLVTRDWRKLARFYVQVFGCVPVPPERKLRGEQLERGTGVSGVTIEGVHLLLPGLENQRATLEIFQYGQYLESPPAAVNRRGLGHLAFAVDDVGSARDAVLAAGGSSVGEIVTLRVPGAGDVTFAYVADPEGNVIELQCWSD